MADDDSDFMRGWRRDVLQIKVMAGVTILFLTAILLRVCGII